ncbi:MAG TPA: hypothetical protein VFF06_01950, partial [Polyangia bacterium]|nr:hypothetical protein [Polyangia bacterium]
GGSFAGGSFAGGSFAGGTFGGSTFGGSTFGGSSFSGTFGAGFASGSFAGGGFAGGGFAIGGGYGNTMLMGPAIGSLSSAGVPATWGAFAGLNAPQPLRPLPIDTRPYLQSNGTVSVSVTDNSTFGVGGQVTTTTSSFSSDVGGGASFSQRITFDSFGV